MDRLRSFDRLRFGLDVSGRKTARIFLESPEIVLHQRETRSRHLQAGVQRVRVERVERLFGPEISDRVLCFDDLAARLLEGGFCAREIGLESLEITGFDFGVERRVLGFQAVDCAGLKTYSGERFSDFVEFGREVAEIDGFQASDGALDGIDFRRERRYPVRFERLDRRRDRSYLRVEPFEFCRGATQINEQPNSHHQVVAYHRSLFLRGIELIDG